MTREKQKEEALARMALIDFCEDVPKQFRENGTIMYSERTPLGGILYWVSNEPEWLKKVKEFEEKFGALVYHATHEYTAFGECLDLLFVSKYDEEWDMDRRDLEFKEKGKFNAMAYVTNLDEPLFSEFGTVGFQEAAGGLIRIA